MKIKIKKTFKLKEIMPLFFHDELYEGFVSDKSISKSKFKKFIRTNTDGKHTFYVLIYNSIPIGLSVLYKITPNCIVAHLGILKKFRGKIAYKIGHKLLEMIFKVLNYKKIIAPIMPANKAAICFVKKLGFQFFKFYKNQELWEMNYG